MPTGGCGILIPLFDRATSNSKKYLVRSETYRLHIQELKKAEINEGCPFTFRTILTTHHQHVYFNSSGGSMSSVRKESSSLTNSQTMEVIWFQLIAWSLLSAELPTLGTSSPTENSANARGPNCLYIIHLYCIDCVDDVVLTSWWFKVTAPLSIFVVVEHSSTSPTLCYWRRV